MILRKAMKTTSTILIAIFTIYIILPICTIRADDGLDPLSVAKKQSASIIPQCKLCTTLIESFNKGMEITSRGKHESGDTQWEESNMRVYSKSEVRLVEILDKLCQNVDRGEDQCHALAETLEVPIENWFLNLQDDEPDFHNWLCVETHQVCCPPNYYGPNCLPCSDCNGNGACKGNGTRKGNGKCSCYAGYEGDACDRCALQYYESYRDDSKLLCTECHIACERNTGCTGAGPKGCRVCKMGWMMQPEEGGCIDIDECATDTHKCMKDEFCVNNEGSYECLKCDRSCENCTGDGPDLCIQCADGYELRDGLCTDKNTDDESKNLNSDEIDEIAIDGDRNDEIDSNIPNQVEKDEF